MRISHSGKKQLKSGNSWGYVVILSVVLIAVLTITALTQPDPASEPAGVFCDAENVRDSMFVSDTHQFFGGQYQSADRAFSGQYSCKLGKDRIYGFRYDIVNPVQGSKYKASVWVSRTSGDRGNLVVSADGDHPFHKEQNVPVFRRDDGWELLQLFFQVPVNDIPALRVYVYVGANSGQVYFDDFQITEIKGQILEVDTITGPLTTLMIDIDKKGLDKLERKKWDAIADGILIASDEDWVDAKMDAAGAQLEAKIRLKGDWLDHLNNNKWSLRIKMKGEQTWNRLSTFSVQSPATRYYLREWLYHQFLIAADVLTPRYDFIRLKLADRDLGVYAYEEHFEKQLVESKQRREGPILKLTEDGFWRSFQKQENVYGAGTLKERMDDAFWQSDIMPFKESKTEASPVLKAQFEKAQNLVYSYKYGELDADEVFDLTLLAGYFAITDLHLAYHGMAWHNLRFYYNPVTARLEPIGFDGFGGPDPQPPANGPFLGYYASTDAHSELFDRLMSEEDFVRKYHQALMKYSDPDWFEALLTELSDEIVEREAFLADEFPDSKLDLAAIRRRVNEVRYFLDPMDNVSLRARTSDREGQYKIVKLSNHFHLPLEVTGYTGDDQSVVRSVSPHVFVPRGPKFRAPVQVEISVPDYARHLVFRLAGVDSAHTTEIVSFTAPSIEPAQTGVTATDLNQFPFIQMIGNEAVIRSGRHTISEHLIFPEFTHLIIEPGTELDLTDNAGIVVNGSVQLIGTEASPIVIRSSDGSASGFTVLSDGSRSEMQHVRFDGLNTWREEGNTLTGAVTFHESDLTIRHCAFQNNNCEDALNTVRCKIDVEGLLVSRTLFDGYDADFCEGRIAQAYFTDISNDALDFSGSAIIIEDCHVNGAGDKGISVGEESQVTVRFAEITGCNIGVASKDLSILEITNIILKDCKQGFTAYQKKPEFGPATLIVDRYELIDVSQPYLIEVNSTLQLGDRSIEGI